MLVMASHVVDMYNIESNDENGRSMEQTKV